MLKIPKFLKSKTIWMGAVTAVAGVWQYAQPFIPPQYLPVALAVSGAAGVVLRTLTSKPISEK